jgi:hypothetical protein
VWSVILKSGIPDCLTDARFEMMCFCLVMDTGPLTPCAANNGKRSRKLQDHALPISSLWPSLS